MQTLYYINCVLDRNKLVVIWDSNTQLYCNFSGDKLTILQWWQHNSGLSEAPLKRLVSRHKLFSGSNLRRNPYPGSNFAPLFITLSWRMTIVIPSKTTIFQSKATIASKNITIKRKSRISLKTSDTYSFLVRYNLSLKEQPKNIISMTGNLARIFRTNSSITTL